MAHDTDNTDTLINDTAIDIEYERYKDWDMSNATPANQNPMIKKLQENARFAQLNQTTIKNIGLDDDITHWLMQQNFDTKRQVNEIIRQVIAMQKSVQNATQKMQNPYGNNPQADFA